MKHIAVITGGDSSEREISLQSGKNIYESIKNDYDVTLIDLNKNSWTTYNGETIDKNDFSYTDKNGQKHTFDFAIIAIHGTPGENGPLQGYLDLIGMPYSSCSREVSTITFNKYLTKYLTKGIKGLGLAKDILLSKDETYSKEEIVDKLGLPLFVKPNASGSSCGVTKVKSIEDLDDAISEAFTESSQVILEEFIEGREIGQGAIIIDGKSLILPITELISSREFFDYTAKYTPGGADEITPANLTESMTDKICNISNEIYKRLCCEGLVRIDYIIKNKTPYFIEINTVPGMSGGSIIPKQLSHMGISMSDIWKLIIEHK